MLKILFKNGTRMPFLERFSQKVDRHQLCKNNTMYFLKFCALVLGWLVVGVKADCLSGDLGL